MKNIIEAVTFFSVIVVLSINSAPCHSAEAWSSTAATIDNVTPGLMKENNTPGVSVVLLDSGKMVWSNCYGVKAADGMSPVTDDTVFEACSMSKPLFAYAFLKLVEQGKFTLDRPLSEYLLTPYLKSQPLHTKITAKMVLTHTTGFPNWRKGGWRGNGDLPVRFEPGSKFGYSGEGFWYLQQVVEHVVKEPLETWSQRVLLHPLKMNNSSYVWKKEYDSLGASGHDSNGKVKPDRPLYKRANAAFSLYTTPTDYARLLIEIMNPDRKAMHSLSAKMIRDMLKPTVKTDSADVWRNLGWVVTKRDGSNLISHSGSNGTGFRCVCRFDPSTSRGIVIMTNAIGGRKVWESVLNSIDWFSPNEKKNHESSIINNCRRYLKAQGDAQNNLKTRIAQYDGPVSPIIKALSESDVSNRSRVSGALLNQPFSHPELKQTHSDDMLHFFVPDAYTPSQPFGLLIFMHGGGRTTSREHPARTVTHPNDDPKSHGLQLYFQDMPYIIVAPSAPWNEKTGARWNVPEADDYIYAVIQECHHRFHIDRDRVFLGGYSMGGFGAYHLCQRLSDRFAGGIIFSGAWKTTHWNAWTGLPLFIRHGTNDAAPRGEDSTGRPRFTDVFYARTAHQQLSKLALPHVYVEDKGSHSMRDATDALSKLAPWMQKQKRDPFAPHVVAVSPRGWKASTDTPTPHTRWITIHETGGGTIPFSRVRLNGPSPNFKETQEDFYKQTFGLDTQQVAAGLVNARIANKNRIVISTKNVKRFSIWLHPSMVDFSKPMHVSVNGKESRHDVKESLLDTLRSYQRRHDWGLVYHAEIHLNGEE